MSRHVSTETLAMYQDGAVSARRAARITAHLSACPRCAGTKSDLVGVSGLLAGTRLPPMPDSLAQRVQLAIANEAAERAASSAAVPAGTAGPRRAAAGAGAGEVAQIPGRPDLPERTRRAPRRFPLPSMSSPLVLRGLAAAGAVVVIAGAGFLLAHGQTASESSSGAGSAAPARQPSMSGNRPTALSGQDRPVSVHYHLKGKILTTTALAAHTNFTRRSLATQVRKDVASTVSLGPKTAKPAPTTPTGGTTSSSQASPGFSVPKLEGCLSRVDAGRKVVLATVAKFLGKPATIIVLGSLKSADLLDIAIVDISCSASNAHFIFRTTIPAG